MLTEANTPAEHARGVLEAIEIDEASFEMDSWIRIPDRGVLYPEDRPAACGTTLCAAGWFAHNAGWSIMPGGAAVKDGVESHVEDVALRLLGENPDDALLDWIFYTNNSTAKNALRILAAGGNPGRESDCYVKEPDDDDA